MVFMLGGRKKRKGGGEKEAKRVCSDIIYIGTKYERQVLREYILRGRYRLRN